MSSSANHSVCTCLLTVACDQIFRLIQLPLSVHAKEALKTLSFRPADNSYPRYLGDSSLFRDP
jgi:hypothetical protein